MSIKWSIWLCFIPLILLTRDVSAQWYKDQRAIMGTEIVTDVWHEDKSQASKCSKQVFAEMERINGLMSPYLPDSELALINREAASKEVIISEELFKLIQTALKFSELSDGAFDITFASAGFLYDYRNKQRPSQNKIDQVLPAINFRHITLNDKNKSIYFTRAGVKIDLGGIAKGYAVDSAIDILKACGINNGMVSAGGDSRILGDRNGWPWMLGVRHPRQKDKVVVKLPLSDTAVSTSGDYERFFIEDGVRYHHIISPKTGHSVSKTWSATVIGDKAVETDALSTTLFVMEVKDALALIDKMENVDAIIIDANGVMHYSSGLMPPEEKQKH